MFKNVRGDLWRGAAITGLRILMNSCSAMFRENLWERQRRTRAPLFAARVLDRRWVEDPAVRLT